MSDWRHIVGMNCSDFMARWSSYLLVFALGLPGCAGDSDDSGGSGEGSGTSDGDASNDGDGGTGGTDGDGGGDGSGDGGSDGDDGEWGTCVWVCSTDADCCVDPDAECPGAAPNNVQCTETGACLRDLCEDDAECQQAHDEAWACLVFDGFKQCHVPCTPETDCLSFGFESCGGVDLEGTEYCMSWGPTNPPGEYFQCESDEDCDGVSSGMWGGIGLKCNDSNPTWVVCGCQSDADCLDEPGWSCYMG
jgi:hypothetical protein